MLDRGHFIVLEGLEGAGKSTALSTIKQVLASYIPEIITTREPGGTRVGEVVRQLIKEPIPDDILEARAELLLFYAARIQLVEQVIRPALSAGRWVLADRFELSTLAYQGGGRHLDQDMIAHLSTFCLQGLQPDLVIFLDVSPQAGLDRARSRGEACRIEQESLQFFTDVYERYHASIQTMNNVVVIDAMQPLDTVQQAIRMALKKYLNDHAITPIY